MNIQINTKEKTIKLAETVNLKELEEVLLKLFPNNEWREYNLETNTVINNWNSPLIIDNWRYYPYYQQLPYIHCGSGGTSSNSIGTLTSNNLDTSIFNLQLN
jgi:hypothetical protein